MSDLRFDNRVAIVSGAGGKHNLGRAYAHLLAANGACVVVNDINAEGAARVAREIADAGGRAIADAHDISTEANAEAIVAAALNQWDRLDIVINNGGAMVFAEFERMSGSDINAMVDSHLKGAIWLSRAAWPHFKKQSYGRIVMALSTAAGRERVMYYTVKGGMIALNYSLALAGAPFGIKVNGIVPLAGTDATVRHTADGPMKQMLMQMSPDLVAPIVGVLCHEDCPVTGEEFLALNGMVQRYVHHAPRAIDPPQGLPGMPGGPQMGYSSPTLTMADVLAHWTDIVGVDYSPLVFPDETVPMN